MRDPDSSPRSTPESAELLADHVWIRGLVQSLVFDRGDADDVAQEAWLASREGSGRGLGTIVRRIASNRRWKDWNALPG